tara:strand:- start:1160 stop:1270 length:111 start_codon:yes stop_codon:yes gene_type:complete
MRSKLRAKAGAQRLVHTYDHRIGGDGEDAENGMADG